MKDYAIIRINKSQYRVEEGQEFLVDLMDEKKPTAEVLFVSAKDKKLIGTPILTKSKVTLSVIGQEKGTKILVQKFRSKSRYRKRIGHRSKFTRLKVDKITA